MFRAAIGRDGKLMLLAETLFIYAIGKVGRKSSAKLLHDYESWQVEWCCNSTEYNGGAVSGRGQRSRYRKIQDAILRRDCTCCDWSGGRIAEENSSPTCLLSSVVRESPVTGLNYQRVADWKWRLYQATNIRRDEQGSHFVASERQSTATSTCPADIVYPHTMIPLYQALTTQSLGVNSTSGWLARTKYVGLLFFHSGSYAVHSGYKLRELGNRWKTYVRSIAISWTIVHSSICKVCTQNPIRVQPQRLFAPF